MELFTGENDKGRRLDRVLRKALPDYPLPLLHRLLRQGKVLLDGKPAKAQDRVESGVKINISDKISHRGTEAQREKRENQTKKMLKTCIKPEILWQGEGLIAVNKPVGIAVHGKNSLDEAVRAYLADKLPPSLSFVPGPLHRLDMGSSGIVIFSASIEGARLFSFLMRERKVKKTYLAIVEGFIEREHIWEDMLVRDKGKRKTFIAEKRAEKKPVKNAVTRVLPFATAKIKGKPYSLITAEIATGRTHQIRAQAAAQGYPLAGDRKYAPSASNGFTVYGSGIFSGGFFLHAWKMEFLDYLIVSPPPQAFRKAAEDMFGYDF